MCGGCLSRKEGAEDLAGGHKENECYIFSGGLSVCNYLHIITVQLHALFKAKNLRVAF